MTNYQEFNNIPLDFDFLIEYLNALIKDDRSFLELHKDKIKLIPEGCKPIINENDEVYGFFATMQKSDGSKRVIEIIRIPDSQTGHKYYTRILTQDDIFEAKRFIISE